MQAPRTRVRRRPPARGCASCFSPCCRGRSHRRPCPGTLPESGPPRQGPGADRRARCRKTRAMRGFSDTHRRRSAATTSVGSRTTWRWVKRRTRRPPAARIASRSRSRSNARRVAMEPPAVDLDDEPAARPVEVDLEAADDRVHPRPGDAVRVAEREERVLELAPRERRSRRCAREAATRGAAFPGRPGWAATTASSAARSNSSSTSAWSSARSTVRRGNVAARSRSVRAGVVTGTPAWTPHSSGRSAARRWTRMPGWPRGVV